MEAEENSHDDEPESDQDEAETEGSPSNDLGPAALTVLTKHGAGGSQSFQVAATDSQKYWCKPLNNPQGEKIPIVEQIVGRLGALLGVDVCEVALVRIPSGLAGEDFAPGKQLEEGWAHGSRHIEDAIEVRNLEHRSVGDNAKRQVGFFALYDWLLGDDPQWMRNVHQDTYWSHDHAWAPAGSIHPEGLQQFRWSVVRGCLRPRRTV
jgi:hypothetical protein